MGSGKSTIGRILAQKLNNSYFLDTDNLIENFENRKISEIFQNDGEEYFRNAEKRVFEWIKENVKNSVISTGGGLPIFVKNINTAGTIIYLKVEFEDIVKRLNKEEIQKRPLFRDLDNAKKLFLQRDKIYTKLADYVIENRNIQESIKNILKKIKE